MDDGLFDAPGSASVTGGRTGGGSLNANTHASAPLAVRMRPRTLDELVGQEQLRAPGSPLRRLVEGDQSMSLLLWGPPGTGKTTIASIVSQQTDRRFVEVSAVSAGVKEVRAWTVKAGSTAPQAAAVIHTDFEKGFIRAETIAFDDFLKYRGEAGARDAGRLRLEGKEYRVQEGDVLHFRFNV